MGECGGQCRRRGWGIANYIIVEGGGHEGEGLGKGLAARPTFRVSPSSAAPPPPTPTHPHTRTWMISELGRHSFLLSSSTVFMFSIQMASTGPSSTIHLRSSLRGGGGQPCGSISVGRG